MTDVEDRLHRDAADWRQQVDGPGRGLVPARQAHTQQRDDGRQRPSARWLIPAAAAVVVAAVVLGAGQLRHPSPGRNPLAPGTSPSVTTRSLTTSTFDGFTFSHPASWLSVPPEVVSAGSSRVVGYLTDQRPIRQCATSVNGSITEVSCHGPVTQLQSGGVLVTVTEKDLVFGTLAPTRTIAGRPATVIRGAPTDCVPGAGYEVDATVAFGFRASGGMAPRLEVVACAGGPVTDQTRKEIDAMLDTATYRDVTAATIAGRLVEIGGPAPGSPRAIAGTILVYRTANRSGTPLTTVRTDAHGNFTLIVDPGTYYLAARSGRCVSAGPTIAPAGKTTRTDVICSVK